MSDIETQNTIAENYEADTLNEVTEPTVKKRKPREPKLKVEEINTTAEQPTRKPRNKKVNVQTLTTQLIGIHKLAATITNQPYLQIAEEEAALMANALIGISEEYEISISGKTGATIQLLAAAGAIYVPRVVHGLKIRKEKKIQAEILQQTGGIESPEVQANTAKD